MILSIVLITIFSCIKWFLILAVLIWLYKNLALPTLPWLVAQYLITVTIALVASLLLKPFSDFIGSYASHAHHLGDEITMIRYITVVLDSTISLLIALLILSEISNIIAQHFPATESRVIMGLKSLHRHVTLLGIALNFLTLVRPAAMAIFWIAHR